MRRLFKAGVLTLAAVLGVGLGSGLGSGPVGAIAVAGVAPGERTVAGSTRTVTPGAPHRIFICFVRTDS